MQSSIFAPNRRNQTPQHDTKRHDPQKAVFFIVCYKATKEGRTKANKRQKRLFSLCRWTRHAGKKNNNRRKPHRAPNATAPKETHTRHEKRPHRPKQRPRKAKNCTRLKIHVRNTAKNCRDEGPQRAGTGSKAREQGTPHNKTPTPPTPIWARGS